MAAESNEEITIKIKLRSKVNKNYIKMVGKASISIQQLISSAHTTKWISIYNPK
jgi:low affinity Fe/Cu permease